MDLRTIVLILLRRWYVAVPIAVLALWFASGSGGSPSYTVESSFLLVTQPVDAEDEIGNPILETPSAVNSAANVAVVIMHSETRRIEIAEAGYAPGYGFSVARNDPFVNLAVAHGDPELATETATVLSNLFVEEMAVQQLRFDADAGALVRAELLEISAPIADYSGVRTTQATYAAAGMLLAFLAAFAVEGVVYFFSDRRKEFAEFNKYELDAARYGVGGESAAEFRPTGTTDPTPLNPPDAPAELERAPSSRWIRSRSRDSR